MSSICFLQDEFLPRGLSELRKLCFLKAHPTVLSDMLSLIGLPVYLFYRCIIATAVLSQPRKTIGLVTKVFQLQIT